jgi:hypothetical protein
MYKGRLNIHMEKTVEEKLITFIAEKFKVSSHKIPHYLRWIRKNIELTGKAGFSDYTQDKFLKDLCTRYTDWQVEQADKAVTIYLSFMRKNHESDMKSLRLDNSVWKNVILNMKEEIKFQNKSQKQNVPTSIAPRNSVNIQEAKCRGMSTRMMLKAFSCILLWNDL